MPWTPNRFAILESVSDLGSDTDSWVPPEQLGDSCASHRSADNRIGSSEDEPIRYVPDALKRYVEGTDDTLLLKRFLKGKKGGLLRASERPPLAKLCSSCESIFGSEKSEDLFDKWHEHHPSLALLQSAAEFGCAICAATLKNYLSKQSNIDKSSSDQDN